MKKIRILIAAPSLDILGGQSRQAVSLIEGLRREPSLEISFLPHNPRLPGLLRFLQKIKYVRTVVTSLLYWAMLLTRVSRWDIIHIFCASYYSYLLSAIPAIFIARLYGKKAVLNYHSGEAEDHLKRWRRTAVPTIRLADEIVVPSGYLVEVFARFGLKARAISNIIELDRFRFRKRGRLRPVFLTSRLLEPLYNVGCVLRAFALVQRRCPGARLTVAGEGWQRKELEKLARELGLRNTEFVGRVPFEKMPELYDSADIYLTATDLDNMPGSVTECMATGLPVVTTNAGGIPYIVTHEQTGLMVERGDYEAMAASAIRLLEDRELASRIARKARKACQEYSWPQVRGEWLRLYHELSSGSAVRVAQWEGETWAFSKYVRPSNVDLAPIRVLVLAPSLDILGGQSRQAVRLIEGLRREPSLEVSFLPHNPRLPGALRWLQKIKYVRTVVTSLLYWATLLVRVSRHDIIHIFSASYYSYLLSAIPAIFIARLYGRKAVLNYRSGEAEDHLKRWRRTAVPIIRLADAIVAPSGYLVDVFARFGLKSRAISNIVELDRFRFRERGKLRPVFLTSRLLEPLYNVGCVLRAFALIQERIPEARLTVAGEGWQRKELEKLARELELRNTEFIGRVPFEQMPELYDSADIYLTATDLDNMPGSVTECMASGLPVVTTNAGGIPYIMTDQVTGLMVALGDHEAMARCAIRLLEDDELASRIARRAREACRKFTWQEVRGEWLELYDELAHEKLSAASEQTASGRETVGEN